AQTLRTLAAAVSAHVEVRRQQLLAAEHHAELAAVLDQAPDAFLSLDAEGRIIAFNSRAEALFGWSRDVIVGLRAADTLVPEGLRDAHATLLAQAAAGGDPAPLRGAIEVPARHRDGHHIPLELTMATLHGEGGARLNVFARDITDRLERERERRSETE